VASTSTSSGPREWLKRTISAQESGLVLVIAVLMTILTLLASPINQRETIRLPKDARVEVLESGDLKYTLESRTVSIAAALNPVKVDDTDATIISFNRTVNKFLNSQNLVGVFRDASFIAVMAVGMMGIIILGGIDLSIGSIYALTAIMGALALQKLELRYPAGAPLGYALVVGLGVCGIIGGACGFANGAASVGLGVHPFIITLGGMSIYRGIAFIITKGQTVSDLPASFGRGFFRAELWGEQPVPVFVMVLVAALGAFVLSRTVFGRQTYAIGGNETAARYAGVPTARVKIAWYTIAGVLAGLSAAMYCGYYGAASTDAGRGYELSVIAAAVVGGASLSGGRGTALGAVLGAIVIQLINNAILILGIEENWKEPIIGLAIIVAVVIDQTKHRVSKAR
jgi:ribose/xylose/arabinose/galactoside ABC-type transport system permease subunit